MTEISLAKLSLKIRSRDKMIFNGDVETLTSINDKGIFDVLPNHANFISLIRDYVELNKGKKDFVRYEFKSGLISVLSNKVDVYVVS